MTQSTRNHMSEIQELLLIDYASGALRCEALSLLAASYAAICPDARARLRHYDVLGGALLAQCCEPVAMAADSLRHVLDRLDGRAASPDQAPVQAPVHAPAPEEAPPFYIDDLPHPLREHIRAACRLSPRTPRAGLETCRIFDRAGGAILTLVRAAPGLRVPLHEHRGREMTLVLRGGYRDAGGVYSAGDLVVMPEGSRHAPESDPNEGCVCVMLNEGSAHFLHLFDRFFRRPW